MNEKAITKKKPMDAMRDLIISRKDQIAMALPKHLTPDRLIRVSLTSIAKNPKLLECSQASVIGAVIQAAQLGLDVDGSLGHAYLVPYKQYCQLQIGYRGMIDLARRSGQIVSISAHVVHKNDKFNYSFGLDDKLEHVPNLEEPGNPIAVYAVAKLQGGGHQFDVLSIAEVEKARKSSMANRSDSPWNTHWDEMAKKTAIRRLFKYLPVSIEIQRAVGLDEQVDTGISQRLESLVIDVESEEVREEPIEETAKGIEKIKQKAKAKQSDGKEEAPPEVEQKPEPVTVSEDAFDVFAELDTRLKELYGSAANEKLAAMCKKAGFKSAMLKENEAGMLLDILNEGAAS